MNVQILIVFASLGLCAAKLPLTSSDLGNLIVKHARNELFNYELKILKIVFRVYRYVWKSVNDVTKEIRCFVCRGAFAALMSLVQIGVSDETIINTGTWLCSIAISAKVCRGFISLNLPILKYIIKTTPEATAKTFCGLWLQSYQDPYTCPYDDPRFEWQIELPPKRKNQLYRPVDVGSKPLTVAVLSDIHIDPLYEPFGVADCDEPVCCRAGQKLRIKKDNYIDERILSRSVMENGDEIMLDIDAANKILVVTDNANKIRRKGKSKPAGYWGDYRNCDTPIWALKDVIEQIASHKEIDVVYYIGDTIDHHLWETTYELNNAENGFIVDEMREILGDDVIFVPTIGNHESQPVNLFAPTSVKGEGLNTTWLYESLAHKWRYYLTENASNSMKKRGGFSMLIRPGLRVISLNNNVAYKFNAWLLYDPLDSKTHLEWLVIELYKAELSGEKVHILSHIPAGDQDLLHTWTREYYRIVDRFSHIISAQFNGHLHSDEFKLFYKDGKAFSVAWGAGSATTLENFNLNYKIVTFDNNNYEPASIVNYIYNLTEANLNLFKPPRWYKLYDMQESFQLQNLTAASMDRLVHQMVTDKKHLLDLYVMYTSKQSDAVPFCNTNCKLEMLCNDITAVLWDRKECDELVKLYFS